MHVHGTTSYPDSYENRGKFASQAAQPSPSKRPNVETRPPVTDGVTPKMEAVLQGHRDALKALEARLTHDQETFHVDWFD